jgi:hypothetical protein
MLKKSLLFPKEQNCEESHLFERSRHWVMGGRWWRGVLKNNLLGWLRTNDWLCTNNLRKISKGGRWKLIVRGLEPAICYVIKSGYENSWRLSQCIGLLLSWWTHVRRNEFACCLFVARGLFTCWYAMVTWSFRLINFGETLDF